MSQYSHIHLTGFNWWSGRGKSTRIKGTVSRYSNFRYKLASAGGQEGGKARGLKGQCHDIHISIKLASTDGQACRGKGQCHDIQIFVTNRLQQVARRGKGMDLRDRITIDTYLMWSLVRQRKLP